MSDDPQRIYRYVDKAGHTVFVNDRSAIPSEFRARAELVDLSHIDLNESLGRDLAAQSADAGSKLPAAADPRPEKSVKTADGLLIPDSPMAPLEGRCLGQLRSEVSHESPWEYAKSNPHVPVILGFVLLLILATPIGFRKMGGERYMRILGRAVPLLLFLLALTHGSIAIRRGARDLRGFLAGKALPCHGSSP